MAHAAEPGASEGALDLVVVSHIDADHISGILWLAEARGGRGRSTTTRPRTGEQPGLPASRARRDRPRSPSSGTTPGARSWATWRTPIEAVRRPRQRRLRTATLDSSTRDGRRPSCSRRSQDLAREHPGRRRASPHGRRRHADPAEHGLRRPRAAPQPAPRGEARQVRAHCHRAGARSTSSACARTGRRGSSRSRRTARSRPPPRVGARRRVHAGVDLSAALAVKHADDERLVRSLAARARSSRRPIRATSRRRTAPRSCCSRGGHGAPACSPATPPRRRSSKGSRRPGGSRTAVFPCNVLKVQHHGSEHNLDQRVRQDRPRRPLRLLRRRRPRQPRSLGREDDRRDAPRRRPAARSRCGSTARPSGRSRRAARRCSAAIREATRAADRHPGITVKVLRDDRAYFDLTF